MSGSRLGRRREEPYKRIEYAPVHSDLHVERIWLRARGLVQDGPLAGWWGLVHWDERYVVGGRHAPRTLAGWVAMGRLRPLRGAYAERGHLYHSLPTFDLPPDPGLWPRLRCRHSGFWFGHLPGDAQPVLPDGWRLPSGGAG